MADKPNILFILTEQHNPHITGFSGNTLVQIKTN